jgi:hypothetical protein
VLGGGDYQGADRPGTVDEDAAATQLGHPADGVQRDGQRLGQGALFGADAVRQGADLGGAHGPVLAEPAVGVRVEGGRAEVADARVEVRTSADPLRQPAVTDRLGRVDGDRLPLDEAAHAGAECGDPPRDLVAEDHGVLERGGAGCPVLPIGDVGPADPAPFHG